MGKDARASASPPYELVPNIVQYKSNNIFISLIVICYFHRHSLNKKSKYNIGKSIYKLL